MESEVRELRATSEPGERQPQVPLPIGAASRMLILLSDTASARAMAGELDEARRLTIDAARLLGAVDTDARSDLRIAALARFALGRALLALEDPAGRALLEDAGTAFEELGDEATVLAIDAALRAAATVIEESPRSFASKEPRADREA